MPTPLSTSRQVDVILPVPNTKDYKADPRYLHPTPLLPVPQIAHPALDPMARRPYGPLSLMTSTIVSN